MSTIAFCYDLPCPNFYANPSGFFSTLEKIRFRKLDLFKDTSAGLTLKNQFDQLNKLYMEYSKKNWDGYGAQPVSLNAIIEARKILDILPSSFPLPEICVEPSGDVGFEWRKGKNMIFVISLSGENIITYAGIYLKNKVHGSEYFGGTLPHVIIGNLQRLYK